MYTFRISTTNGSVLTQTLHQFSSIVDAERVASSMSARLWVKLDVQVGGGGMVRLGEWVRGGERVK